ncbi:MAG: FAD:protein transferase [Streptosporangiaceae bacterium]|jgi:thiamine biosynthesis lipoprotein|nr:FAD:protein transferase [Streptosporangiaceae bacterium]
MTRSGEAAEELASRTLEFKALTFKALTFKALGTVVSLIVTDGGARAAAYTILGEELSTVDAACSRFRADSELSQLNRAAGRRLAISRFFADALATALGAAQVTDGDVDPTCGRSLVGIGYDRDFAEVRRDTMALGRAVTAAAGWRTVELDPVRCTARVPDGVLLDLGATAKALAADRAAARIAAAVGCGVLVNLGGDISVAGQPPPDGWCIGVIDDLGPDDDAGAGGSRADAGPAAGMAAVTITDGGLATSSTAVRAWQRGAEAFHHIVVPGTGRPADTCWRTVSVAAASCVDANTASTASIIRGERAPAWLESLRLPARLVRRDGTVATVGGWPAEQATAGGWPAEEAPAGSQPAEQAPAGSPA